MEEWEVHVKLHTACTPGALDMAFTLPKCPQLLANRSHNGAGQTPRETET
jgi:hypothetical protein